MSNITAEDNKNCTSTGCDALSRRLALIDLKAIYSNDPDIIMTIEGEGTYNFLEIYYKGDPIFKLGPNSSSGLYRLSFEPSTTYVECMSLFM